MNASRNWLQAFLTVPLTAERMRDLITARCCPVDELVALRDDLNDVIVGLVVVVRVLRRAEDLFSTVLAVLAGLIVTVSPPVLTLTGR